MSELAARVLDGCHASAARVIRWVEDEDPNAIPTLQQLYRHAGRAHIIGVTGPPGSGKSTLVGALVTVLRASDQRVGVIAVDPSSPFSGGAILGDRVRMQRHATDPGVFIRSMATRGMLGGLARATIEACVVLDAMGQDVLVVETVGVGQDELEIAALAHTTVVVNVPGLGDEIQALKAGILEVGQIFVLNKADRPGAEQTERQLRLMLHLRAASEDGWEPPLLRTVAPRDEGVAELAEACAEHRTHLVTTGAHEKASADLREHLFRELLKQRALTQLLHLAESSTELNRLLSSVRSLEIDPHTAAERLIDALLPSSTDP